MPAALREGAPVRLSGVDIGNVKSILHRGRQG
jgi:ABC-type transporter Mla subunit MlaD